MTPEALVIFGLLINQVPGTGKYPLAIEKAKEATYIQTGAKEQADRVRGDLERAARHQMEVNKIPQQPLIVGAYAYRIYRDRQITVPDVKNPLLTGSRVGGTLSKDSVYVRFTLGF